MATAKTKTLLSLDEFARYAGIHPMHFNQITTDEQPGVTCGDVLLQYSWQQADKIGREELAQVIADCEQIIEDQLGYSPATRWVEDRILYPSLYSTYDPLRYGGPIIKASKGYVISGGIEAWSEVALAAPVVYTDSDADGYAETATVSVSTSITEPAEIAIRYPGAGPEWQIRPVQVSIAAGTATITFRREQAVVAALLEQFGPQGVDGKDNTSFIASVDVYRHYNDNSRQVEFVWDNGPCWCGNTGCDACSSVGSTGCMIVKDSRLGLVALQYGTYDAVGATWDLLTPQQCRAADRVVLWYKAGMVGPNPVEVPSVWGRAITYLALSKLDRPLCACDSLKAFTAYWSLDFSESTGSQAGSTAYRTSRSILENPIGMTRAALYVWNLVKAARLGL